MKILIQKSLFIMSMSGSVIILLYILTYPIAKRYFSLRWQYSILKLSIFFYLIPIHQLKYIMIQGINFILPMLNLRGDVPEAVWLYDKQTSIFIDSGVHYGILYFLIVAYYFIFLCIALSLILHQLLLNIKFKDICFKYTDSVLSPEWFNILKKLRKELNITKQIMIISLETCKMPMVLGIIHPVIILPKKIEDKFPKIIMECILKHELIHIKHHDILIKYLGLLVVILHCFNPLSYILYHEICIMSELFCDNEVIKNYDDLVRKEYSNLLIDLSTRKNINTKQGVSLGLVNNDFITLKRRIKEMKYMKKAKNLWLV